MLQEIEKDANGKQLFMSWLRQVKQNGNGDYIVALPEWVMCIKRNGECKWRYQTGDDVLGLLCDAHNNVIIAYLLDHIILLLSSEGQKIRTLMSKQDGLDHPISLSLDWSGHLWIGQENHMLKVIKYLK